MNGPPSPPLTLEDFYGILHKQASRHYRRHPNNEHPPTMVLLDTDDAITVVLGIAAMFGNDDEQARVFAMHRLAATMPGTRCAALVTEAWGVNLPAEGGFRREDLPPRLDQDSRAVESLLFNLLTPNQQAVMSCRIDRKTRTLERAPFRFFVPENKAVGRAVR